MRPREAKAGSTFSHLAAVRAVLPRAAAGRRLLQRGPFPRCCRKTASLARNLPRTHRKTPLARALPRTAAGRRRPARLLPAECKPAPPLAGTSQKDSLSRE